MKKFLLLIIAVVALCCTACHKDKQCRCAVKSGQDVRMITLKRGNCNDLYYVRYDRNETILDVWDTVFCTDFEFVGDSIFKE
ncbi:MAG: hypothetical protein J6X62_06985 [Bacteroidales bacterium]|nr:hypothetical protein [Bacteroidales bacterium]